MAGDEAGQPRETQASHESLGLRLFSPAPADFNPIQASDRELLIYGYPGRPDAQLFPELRLHWEQMMSRPMRFIQPEFGPAPFGRRGSQQLSYAPPLPGGYGWAGASAFAADGDAFTFVTGQWTVPAVVVPSGQQGVYACANCGDRRGRLG